MMIIKLNPILILLAFFLGSCKDKVSVPIIDNYTIGTISGKVTSSIGNGPLKNVLLRTVPLYKTAYTDSLGNYSLMGIPYGSYKIIVIVDSFLFDTLTVTLNQAAITLNKVMSPTIYGNWKVTQISGGIGNTEQYPTGLTELYNFTNQYIRTDTSLSQPYLANFTLTRGRSIFSSDSVDIVDYHDDMNIINREYSFKTLDTLIMSDHAFDGFYYKMFRANN